MGLGADHQHTARKYRGQNRGRRDSPRSLPGQIFHEKASVPRGEHRGGPHTKVIFFPEFIPGISSSPHSPRPVLPVSLPVSCSFSPPSSPTPTCRASLLPPRVSPRNPPPLSPHFSQSFFPTVSQVQVPAPALLIIINSIQKLQQWQCRHLSLYINVL